MYGPAAERNRTASDKDCRAQPGLVASVEPRAALEMLAPCVSRDGMTYTENAQGLHHGHGLGGVRPIQHCRYWGLHHKPVGGGAPPAIGARLPGSHPARHTRASDCQVLSETCRSRWVITRLRRALIISFCQAHPDNGVV